MVSPAHAWLYSPFDAAIGHIRRYTRASLIAAAPPGVVLERSAYLGIRLDYLYSIYLLFSVGVIVRYGGLIWRALRGHPPDIQIGSGSAL